MPRLNEASLCILVRYTVTMVFTSIALSSSLCFNLQRIDLLKRAARWSMKSHCAVDLALIVFLLYFWVYHAV